MRISVGPLAELVERTCLAVGDGTAVVVRDGQRLRAFRNRCLHQDSPLAGGWVRDGVISCPLHFWRYRVDDGTHLETGASLDRFPVEVVDGDVFVTVPDARPAGPLRDQLLARAATYDRDQAYRDRNEGPPRR